MSSLLQSEYSFEPPKLPSTHSEVSIPPPKKADHKELWESIVKETEDLTRDAKAYKLAKENRVILEPTPHPIIDYLNETVFPTLNFALTQMLYKVKEQEHHVFTEGDFYLNYVNFIAEHLWNMNPLHPERKENWTDITCIYSR